jgi:hypothetical protein
VFVNVTINDPEAAQAQLRDRVVPQVSGAPGFVAAYWAAVSDSRGASVALFESEEAARAIAGTVQAPPGEAVSIDSVEVGEVIAQA